MDPDEIGTGRGGAFDPRFDAIREIGARRIRFERGGVVLETLVESPGLIEQRVFDERGRGVADSRKRFSEGFVRVGQEAHAGVIHAMRARRQAGQDARHRRRDAATRYERPAEAGPSVRQAADAATRLARAAETAELIRSQGIDRDEHQIGSALTIRGAAGEACADQAEAETDCDRGDERPTRRVSKATHGPGIAKKTCHALEMLSAFHSAVVSVRDHAAAVNHYASLFGRPASFVGESKDGEPGPGAGPVALFRLDNMCLELRQADSPEGLVGIRLEAEHLADVQAACAARQVSLASARTERVGAPSSAAESDAVRRLSIAGVEPKASRGLPVSLVEVQAQAPALDAPADLDDRAGIRALDHVVVLSPAIDRTRAFYDEGLGIRLALDKTFEARGVRLLFFRLGGTTIEIGGRVGVEEDPAGRDRFGGLAWQVVQIDAIQERLLGAGFDVSEIRDGNKPGTRVCTVRDRTHGVPTLLIEPVSR